MKNKIKKILVCVVICIALITGIMPVSAELDHNNPQSVIESIIDYKTDSSVQNWINGEISAKAGISSDWYVVGLSQYGSYDFSSYERALKKYLSEREEYSASSRQKLALALMAAGSTDSYIYKTLNDSIGKLGVMSWVYGLHLLNNGYKAQEYTTAEVISKLLSLQKDDGGWLVTGKASEVDPTAMAVQALAPHYSSDSAVKTSVDKAISFLSSAQNDNGDFSSYGVPNPESAAQVLVTLSSLGIDAKTDRRFIKNSNTVFDGINTYRLQNGGYSHKQGGEYSDGATVQVFYSMVSYIRMQSGKSGLYLLDNAPKYEELEMPNTKPQNSSSTQQSTSTVVSQTQNAVGSSTQSSINPSSNDAASYTSEIVSDSVIDETDSDAENSTSDDLEFAEKEKESLSQNKKSISYKVWVCIAIVLIAVGVCIWLYFGKKGNKSNYLLVAGLAAVAILIVLFTNFQTTDSYYGSSDSEKENAIGQVTMSIVCDDIPDKSAEHIPNNGVILENTEYSIEAGDTVYDILLEATQSKKIHLDISGESDAVYVRGLNNIYEFDFGEASGWKYKVNGEEPSESCGQYELTPKDKIVWFYSVE